MRKVIEYLRKKNNVTIEDLVVEICSSTMYYKYLSKEKNLSNKNLLLIKERLGADNITEEEIAEYKEELDIITSKILRYYSTKKEFENDMQGLIEIEAQFLLCEKLFIPYTLIKISYDLVESNTDEAIELLDLLDNYYDKMNITEKLLFHQSKIFIMNYQRLDIKEENAKFMILLDNNRYEKNYGYFYMSIVYNFLKLKDRSKAMYAVDFAIEIFQKEMNLVGQVKAYNMKACMLGEDRKYKEALDIFIPNYDNAKRISGDVEVFVCLSNIISCYLGLNDLANARKYWGYFKNRIFKKNDEHIIRANLNNSSISLFTNFEYYGMYEELKELVEIIETFKVNNVAINNLIEYYKLENIDDKIGHIEKNLLPAIIGKAHFTYCKWMLDSCIRYFVDNRRYKKATEFEMTYLNEFKKYYFN